MNIITMVMMMMIIITTSVWSCRIALVPASSSPLQLAQASYLVAMAIATLCDGYV